MDQKLRKDMNDLDKQIETLFAGALLSELEVEDLCEKAKEIFVKESNVHSVKAPVTVCGDIRGHFEDLLEIFRLEGKPPDTNYLFLGSYTRMGNSNISTLSLLLALKVRYSERVTLLRGKFDSIVFTQERYMLYDECCQKYGNANIWKCFIDVLHVMPLTAVIENKIFCVYSGLSPMLETLDSIRALDRTEDDSLGAVNHLLSSNPTEDCGWRVVGAGSEPEFGSDITIKFNHVNNLELIARGHQIFKDGYKEFHGGKLVSLFSAANYAYGWNNLGGFMNVNESTEVSYIQFETDKKDDTETQLDPDYFRGKQIHYKDFYE